MGLAMSIKKFDEIFALETVAINKRRDKKRPVVWQGAASTIPLEVTMRAVLACGRETPRLN
jgi:hypothetical protein